MSIFPFAILKYNESIWLLIRSFARGICRRFVSSILYSRGTVIAYPAFCSIPTASSTILSITIRLVRSWRLVGKQMIAVRDWLKYDTLYLILFLTSVSPVMKQNKLDLTFGWTFSLLNNFLVTVLGDYELEQGVTWWRATENFEYFGYLTLHCVLLGSDFLDSV
ncbi:hypothetical protein LIPSTDRAFT_185589 [Lipomyces starkeyi NRRL Y-11557]|uniref:Uncharacterized protein n=1 Tax=Lipomyces starkeyi NRRL Y-11557 TaxID=675824 RepID=A0A1E3PX54_LIPST|nr:hypothetical protein LIPSTDRAFT_185589 [Lipomyces starkeyi NRRL Y-11557]